MRKARVVMKGEVFWFAEVEPDCWLGIDCEPEPGDEAKIVALLDGDGKSRPMTSTTRYFGIMGHEYEISEIEE